MLDIYERSETFVLDFPLLIHLLFLLVTDVVLGRLKPHGPGDSGVAAEVATIVLDRVFDLEAEHGVRSRGLQEQKVEGYFVDISSSCNSSRLTINSLSDVALMSPGLTLVNSSLYGSTLSSVPMGPTGGRVPRMSPTTFR